MDDLIRAFNVVLNFVNCVQYNCDQRRTLLEALIKKEFQHYVKDWNRKEDERKRKEEKERQEKESIQLVQENLEVLELEEIAKADNLLRKAKLIREKFKVPSFDDLGEIKILSKTTSRIGFEYAPKDMIEEKSVTMKMKQSTSMPSIDLNKINKANLNKNRQIKDQNRGTRNTLPRDKCIKTSNSISFVTKSQLHSYLHVCNKPTVKKDTIVLNKDTYMPKSNSLTLTNYEKRPSGGNKTSKTHLETQKKFISTNLIQDKYQPTYHDFLNYTHECQNFSRIDLSHSLWYPLLNPTNASRLTRNIKCQSAKELRQAYALLYHIQEIVFWLDLFHLVGKEVIPILKATHINQQDATIIESYIQSIFHPKLLRKPIILQSDGD